jgi:hypothetical protein
LQTLIYQNPINIYNMFDKRPKFIQAYFEWQTLHVFFISMVDTKDVHEQGYEYVTIQNKVVNTFEVEVKC